MPLTSPNTVTILPTNQTSGGSVKNNSNVARYTDTRSGELNARELIRVIGAMADALKSIQSQIDHLTRALQTGTVLPNPIQVLDPSGNVVVQLGDFLDPENMSRSGLWANMLWFGGTGPGSTGSFTIAGPRPSGWVAPTGAVNRTTFDTATVTLPQLAQHVAALIDDLLSVGIIGP